MIIQSLQNEKIKKLTKILTKNNERKKLKIFAAEGRQENERALKFDFEAVEFFICKIFYKDITIIFHRQFFFSLYLCLVDLMDQINKLNQEI